MPRTTRIWAQTAFDGKLALGQFLDYRVVVNVNAANHALCRRTADEISCKGLFRCIHFASRYIQMVLDSIAIARILVRFREATSRHSCERGNPVRESLNRVYHCCYLGLLDSRVRGNDIQGRP